MKFTTALVLSSAAAASAAAVAVRDACPAVAKTVKLTWVELHEFTVAHTITKEEAKAVVDNSKPDDSQVYPSLNLTYGGGKGYSTGRAYPSTTTKATATLYPTGGRYSNSTMTTSTTSGSASGTGGSSGSSSTALPSSSGGGGGGASSSSTGGTSTSGGVSTTTTSSASSTSSSAAPTSQGACTNPQTRLEWRNANDDQRDGWVAAIKCLMGKPSTNTNVFLGSRNLFEDLASVHQQLTPVVHGSGAFLVWHRYFIHVLYTLMQEECGYSGPYLWWDETKDAGKFAQAPLFTSRWFGVLPGPVGNNAVCITETGWGDYEPNLGPNDAINNPHCLSRAVNEDLTQNTSQDWVNGCVGAQNYDAFRTCNEGTYHAYGHNGIGAIMSNVYASPEDPVFYQHHGYIDREYRSWQKGGSTRNFEVGGSSASGGTTKPSDVLTSFGLRPDVTIADVLDTEGDYLCYVYDSE